MCFAYARDKTDDAICCCVVEIFGVMHIPHIITAAGVTSLFPQLTSFVFPLLFPVGLPLLIRLDKQKAQTSADKLVIKGHLIKFDKFRYLNLLVTALCGYR